VSPSPSWHRKRVRMRTERSGTDVIRDLDALHARVCLDQRELLCGVAEADRAEAWRDWGARDMAHWLAMRYSISEWKARRWIAAAHALEHLPRICEAFTSGLIGIDKVAELTRFATAQTEARLLRWAERVSGAAIRHRGDVEARRELQEAQEAERNRFLQYWYTDDVFGLHAELPSAQGAVITKALDQVAETIPMMPGSEDDPYPQDARRADALVALCSAGLAADPDPDRATVVVHARLEELVSGEGGCEIEDGPAIHPETARRLLCDARVQAVIEDTHGEVVRVGRMRREPSAWMLRQLKHRDRGCRFPRCGNRRFAQAHHLQWWSRGGRTELENLALICTFHHKLVHEYGWNLSREADGEIGWFRPDGTRHRAGPAPPAAGDGTQPIRELVAS
jgi:hypothetical protein